MTHAIPTAALDDRLGFLGMTGSGKALSLDTPLPTPTGWTTMGVVRVGDVLFDEEGLPCTVTFATEIQHDRECFELTFSDGTTVVADADHLWLTITDASRIADDNAAAKLRRGFIRVGGRENRWQCRRRSWPALLDTKAIKDTLITSRNRLNHAVRNSAPLKLPETILPINPYVLGCWLGDGTSCTGTLTTADQEVIDNIRARGFQIGDPFKSARDTKCETYRIAFGPSGVRFTTILREAGLLSNKHVPFAYLRASEAQRLELLAGLMDTDGTVSRGSNSCVFYNTNEQLARDAYELVCSLGWGATWRTKRAVLNGVDHGICYEVRFRPRRQVFALKRKGDLLNFEVAQGIRYLRRMIRRVTPVDSVPVRCIQVDSPSRLYLCSRSFIPTHNTYSASSCVERILARHGRVIIPDPLGVWWGLRLLADGKTPSDYEIVIFGGAHADLPLTPHAGALIGETVAGMRESAIIDLSSFETAASERSFMLAFLEALYRKSSGEPVHLVFDEADLFAPERILDKEGNATKLHGTMQTIVRRGRIKGLTSWLISQRPAALSKNVLSQVDGLVAFRLTASQDRKALGLWIEGQSDRDAGKAILGRLPEKKMGEAVVWLPARGILADVTFPVKETYDSSRAPKRGEKRKAVELKPVDLGALKDRLATVEAEVKASDPKMLRAEIVRLKSDIQKLSVAKTDNNRPDPEAVAKAEERGFEQAKKKLAAAAEIELQTLRAALVQKFGDAIKPLVTILKDELSATQTKRNLAFGLPFTPSVLPTARNSPAATSGRAVTAPTRKTIAGAGGNGALPPGERAILVAAVQYQGVDRDQLSVLTGYKRSSRDAYIQRLREKGYIDASGQTISPTDTGATALGGDYEPLPTGADLQRYWQERLPEGEGRILAVLVEAYPEYVDRNSLDEITGYKRSSRDAYLQRLKARRLVEIGASAARASDKLF